MLIDKNGKQIQEGDWIRYVYGEADEIGGLQVVSKNGVLGIIEKSIFGGNEEFIKLSTTDLKHCEVVRHGEKKN